MEHLQDRVAVVTGAASGLGLAMSNRFAQAVMKVVLADIEADRLDAAVRELRAAGHDATGVVTDVADADAVNRLAAAAFDTHGAVHVLCNNAGVVKRARGAASERPPYDRGGSRDAECGGCSRAGG